MKTQALLEGFEECRDALYDERQVLVDSFTNHHTQELDDAHAIRLKERFDRCIKFLSDRITELS